MTNVKRYLVVFSRLMWNVTRQVIRRMARPQRRIQGTPDKRVARRLEKQRRKQLWKEHPRRAA